MDALTSLAVALLDAGLGQPSMNLQILLDGQADNLSCGYFTFEGHLPDSLPGCFIERHRASDPAVFQFAGLSSFMLHYTYTSCWLEVRAWGFIEGAELRATRP